MPALRRRPALRIAAGTQKTSKLGHESTTAVTAERVKEMLLESAFVLHATRVVRRMVEGGGVKEA